MKRIKIEIKAVVDEFRDSQQNQFNIEKHGDSSLTEILKNLSKNTEGGVGVASWRLYTHIEFNAVEGVLDILDGNMDGWKAVKRLLQYESWYFQYDCKRHEQLPRLHQIYRSNNATLCIGEMVR